MSKIIRKLNGNLRLFKTHVLPDVPNYAEFRKFNKKIGKISVSKKQKYWERTKIFFRIIIPVLISISTMKNDYNTLVLLNKI
jgi:hypothetical protein